jgi:hypothetical protein
MRPYDHLVQIDEDTRELKIWRVDADGTRTFYTSTELPHSSGWKDDRLEVFAKQLGENLLMDSPVARKLLKL